MCDDAQQRVVFCNTRHVLFLLPPLFGQVPILIRIHERIKCQGCLTLDDIAKTELAFTQPYIPRPEKEEASTKSGSLKCVCTYIFIFT